MSTQKIDTFYSSCYDACLKCEMRLKNHLVFRKAIQLRSDARVRYFTNCGINIFRCGEEIHEQLCQISSGFYVPNITKIGLFSTSIQKEKKVNVKNTVHSLYIHTSTLHNLRRNVHTQYTHPQPFYSHSTNVLLLKATYALNLCHLCLIIVL